MSASGEMLNVASTLVSASEMGLYPLTVLLPKQQFRVTYAKAASICFAVMSACLCVCLSVSL